MTVGGYTDALRASAASGHWQTAEGVAPEDMNSLTHKLRYQAEQLRLLITIHTDPEKGTVSFLCSPEGSG
jgi:hypothetical protein